MGVTKYNEVIPNMTSVVRNYIEGPLIMKLTTLFFVLLSNIVVGQTNDDIIIGKRDSLFSKILNENRELIIYVPQLENEYVQSATYPVLYLLDGDKLFTQTIGILEHLSSEYGSDRCPKMIVVGIVNYNRIKDLLPVSSDEESENNDDFTQFLEKELIPYIDKKYPTQPYRTILGHSLGGLRVANTLVYQPQLFNAYVALDPSLGHDMKVWSEKAHKVVPTKKYNNQSYYMAMAQTMPKSMDTTAIWKDTTGESRHMRSIMKFAHDIGNVQNNKFNFSWKYYPDKTHSEVTFIGTYDGLQSIFNWYYNPEKNTIFKKEITSKQAVEIIEKKFEAISLQMGYSVLPPEEYVMNIIGLLLNKGQTEKAISFAKLNIKNYSKSELAVYYLGEIEKEK
jgi:predicted alpha/beta superfamily hydrolase